MLLGCVFFHGSMHFLCIGRKAVSNLFHCVSRRCDHLQKVLQELRNRDFPLDIRASLLRDFHTVAVFDCRNSEHSKARLYVLTERGKRFSQVFCFV